jgi:signal transduction histidine kinase/CheY-like chemotaxis protein
MTVKVTPVSSVTLHFDYDLVAARRRARQIAGLLSFEEQDQTRIATVVSEMARNALRYARGGRVEFEIHARSEGQSLVITVSDRGPGILNLEEILSGHYVSSTGMGLGLLGAQRLMDDFKISSSAETGTTVRMFKRLPDSVPPFTPERLKALVDSLARLRPEGPIEEIQQQNAELLQALGELNRRREEQDRLNQELEDTNRGVLALYAELDEKAASLRHADLMKSRFLADMGHEFRTPVNSILALTRLLDEADLDDASRKQVSLIRRASEALESLVNDLLDLARIEAGKVEVRPAEFDVTNFFSALRGMLRPLLVSRSVSLVFDEEDGLPVLWTDEGKLSQILRNFISNALKFTEAGEIRVHAKLVSRDTIRLAVSDTGIGIAPEDQERIFEEFTQVDGPLQKRHKGTGLGLPLTRKLAAILGGIVGLESRVGLGSTFWVEIPLRYPGGEEAPAQPQAPEQDAPTRQPDKRTRVLVIDDDEAARYAMTAFASQASTDVIDAENGTVGIARAQKDRPDVIFLDLMMPGIGGHEVLQKLKNDRTTSHIPVFIVTSRLVNEEERQQILTKAVSIIYKGDLSREVVTRAIETSKGR